jgi:hypothetical protein
MDHTIEETLNDIASELRSVMDTLGLPGRKDAITVELSMGSIGASLQLLVNVVRRIAEKQHMLHDESSWRF